MFLRGRCLGCSSWTCLDWANQGGDECRTASQGGGWARNHCLKPWALSLLSSIFSLIPSSASDQLLLQSLDPCLLPYWCSLQIFLVYTSWYNTQKSSDVLNYTTTFEAQNNFQSSLFCYSLLKSASRYYRVRHSCSAELPGSCYLLCGNSVFPIVHWMEDQNSV